MPLDDGSHLSPPAVVANGVGYVEAAMSGDLVGTGYSTRVITRVGLGAREWRANPGSVPKAEVGGTVLCESREIAVRTVGGRAWIECPGKTLGCDVESPNGLPLTEWTGSLGWSVNLNSDATAEEGTPTSRAEVGL